MSHTIQHRGKVERISKQSVFVVVEQQSACAGCHAKGLCGNSGSNRIIEVRTPRATEYTPGDRVIVALLKPTMGAMSILLGYILPLIVLLATLFIAKGVELKDGPAAVLTLAMVAAYYIALWLARRRFDRKIQFTIIKE